MVCKVRHSPSGAIIKPVDLCESAAIGSFLGIDSAGFVWVPPPLLPYYRKSLVISTTIPELAAQERGSCTVSLIGTELEFIEPGMPLLVDALEESMSPAVNNGMYITCRISAHAEVKLYFIGKITAKVLPYLLTVFY